MSAVSAPKPTMPKLIAWSVLCLALVSPFAAWLATVPDASRYLRFDNLPAGQPLYIAAKLLGLLGICLFWLQCMLALARRTPASRWLPTMARSQHIALGLTTVACIVLHVGLFVAAASWRTGHIAWDLLLPSLGHGFYRTSVGLGAAALWICLLAVYGGGRLVTGASRWRWVHMLWPLVFGLVFVHAVNIGTESRYGAMRYWIWGLAASLAALGVWRVVASLKK